MKDSYFTFSLDKSLYGINAVYIEEVFSLPEFTPMPLAFRDIIGVLNIRGDILPVMNLLNLSDQSLDYCLTDSIIVLRSEELRLGIIVNEVHGLSDIDLEGVTANLASTRKLAGGERIKFAVGIASAGDVLILSDPEKLFHSIEMQQFESVKHSLKKMIQDSYSPSKFQANDSVTSPQQPIFCPNANLEERAIFRQRSKNLNQLAESHNSKNLIPLAVIVLDGHLFGIDLKNVREFVDIHNITPIPCCPAYIFGNMNLRGEILTLIDIRSLLNLTLVGTSTVLKAMVVDFEGMVAGVMVEEVCDVMFLLNPIDITTVPTAIHSVNDGYIQGFAPYHERMMRILDLPEILLNGGLIVDEAI